MGLAALGGLEVRHALEALRAPAKRDRDELWTAAASKLERQGLLSRAELAAFLGLSTKQVQRMEAAGTLRRCPGLGTVVRYAARDVLKLASAR